MTQAWFQVLSLCFGYISAALIALIVLLAARKYASDRAVYARVMRHTPQVGAAGVLRVLSGGRRLAAGEELSVPYEGTMGSGHSCDICIPVRKVHMRSAFFWMEEGRLHMAALHRDGVLVDDVPVEPGDEAVLEDGAVVRVGDAKLVLRLYGAKRGRGAKDDPYVTSERRRNARQGRGEGIGAPGKGEIRREKKLMKQRALDRAGADGAKARKENRDGKGSRTKRGGAGTIEAMETIGMMEEKQSRRTRR